MERIANLASNFTAGEDIVLYETQGNVGIVTLNSVQTLNALSDQLFAGIAKALSVAASDLKVKVVVLKSSVEKAFCAGANLKGMVGKKYENQLVDVNFTKLRHVLSTFSKPIVVAVNSLALGGGFELALFGDVIVCDVNAKFGFPEIKVGLFPGLGGTLISKTIGRHRASLMIFTGENINAEEAKNLGIVQRVFDNVEETHKGAMEIANKIAKFSLYSLILAKRSIKFSANESGSLALENEAIHFASLFSMEAAKEGTTAFMEKRKPNFSDK